MKIDVNIHVHFHAPVAEKAPPWAVELKGLIAEGIQTIMSTVEELEPLVAEILSVVGKVSADTDKLLADLAAIPTAGLTQESKALSIALSPPSPIFAIGSRRWIAKSPTPPDPPIRRLVRPGGQHVFGLTLLPQGYLPGWETGRAFY